MNREQKAAVIEEITADINSAHAIFAVDYRGVTVAQVQELRGRLREADATLRVVKNSLGERAADQAGAERLKSLLAGPTALTFVRGDAALAAKSLADFARITQLLAFKGGVMDGAELSIADVAAISRLPSRDVLYGQLVGLIASPVAGLARTLQALISGLAVGLGGVLEQKGGAPAVAAEPPVESPPAPEVEVGAGAPEPPAPEAAAAEAGAEPAGEAEPAGAAEPEAPAAEEPAAEEPAAEEPAAEEPAAEEPAVEEPAVEEPAAEEPAAEEPVAEESVEAPTAEAASEDDEA
jgi:large subunit ribosomal protein L10